MYFWKLHLLWQLNNSQGRPHSFASSFNSIVHATLQIQFHVQCFPLLTAGETSNLYSFTPPSPAPYEMTQSQLLCQLLFKNWTIVDLQCCVSLRCTAKWFSYTYIYIYSFSGFFHCKLLQDIEYSFLWYTVGPWFSNVNSYFEKWNHTISSRQFCWILQ